MSEPSAFAMDITEAEFEAAVIERSFQTPVLVDFWAPWCAPCRSLKPVLEKLAAAYAGRFLLAKLNSDEAPAVSARFAVRSIPAVKLFSQGQVVDEFMGALPEAQVRSFLDRWLPDDAEKLRRAAGQVSDMATRIAMLEKSVSLAPDRLEARLDLAGALLDAAQPAQVTRAAELLESVERRQRDERWLQLQSRLSLAREGGEGIDVDALNARVQANPRDFEARFALARQAAHDGRWADAFEHLLEVVMRDRAEAREQARQWLVEWFALCPDLREVMQARRTLSMYLNG